MYHITHNMKKPIKYFKLLLTYVKFNFTMYNYDSDEMLTYMLNTCLDSGIVNIAKSGFHIYILFGNDIILRGWNENRYYAWLKHGQFISPTDTIYKWDHTRPTKKTLVRLYYEIKNHGK